MHTSKTKTARKGRFHSFHRYSSYGSVGGTGGLSIQYVVLIAGAPVNEPPVAVNILVFQRDAAAAVPLVGNLQGYAPTVGVADTFNAVHPWNICR